MRIETVFDKKRRENKKVFAAYIAAGDPTFEDSLRIADILTDSGVDILELGVPFSDPLADGEANQLAAERALADGMTPLRVLELSSEIRRRHPELPLVLFTYINPIVYMSDGGFDSFCRSAVSAGIDALLPLDLPPDERGNEWREGVTYSDTINETGIPTVSLIAPNTPEKRIPLLAEAADAFIYYVSREGVTGEGSSFSGGFNDRIALIRKYTDLPVVVGFGISSPEHVRNAAAAGVDGVVVGSAIVRRIEKFAAGEASLQDIEDFVRSMTAAASL